MTFAKVWPSEFAIQQLLHQGGEESHSGRTSCHRAHDPLSRINPQSRHIEEEHTRDESVSSIRIRIHT